MSNDLGALQTIEELVRGKQKIQAIKAWRELTGYGLKEAKDAVEHFDRFGSWNQTDIARLGESRGAAVARAAERAFAFAGAAAEDPSLLGSPPRVAPEPSREVSDIVATARGGNKIAAIKLFRERFGVGLKEAKDAVEALVDGRPILAPRASAAYRAPAPHQAALATAVQATAVQATAPAAPHTAATPFDADAERARKLLAEKLGDAHPPLASARGECGLFKGHLLLTQERLCFVADRYGNLELTENLERKQIESVDVKRDPFGFELAVLAGFHTAHFSELDEATARTFAALLKGEPPPQVAAKATGSSASHPTSNGGTHVFDPASQPVAPAPATPPGFGISEGAGVGELQTPKKFNLGGIVVSSLLAGLPLALLGSAYRFFPMEDFPAVAYSVLYWSCLALGGAFRGRGVAMLKVALVVGAVGWVIRDLGHVIEPVQWLALIVMGAAYGRAQPTKSAVLGAILAVPVSLLNGILTGIVGLIEYVPTLGVAFWFVHFAVEDFRASRPQPAAKA